MFSWIVALILFLCLTPKVILASSTDANTNKPELSIVADEAEVIIPAWHASGASYSRSVRLTAKSTDPNQRGEVTFIFLSYDLVNQKDGKVLDRQYVTLEPKGPNNVHKLLLNTPTNFQVKVTGIEVPGTYKGQLEFWPNGAARDKSLKLGLTVKAIPAMPLTARTDKVKTLALSKGWLSEKLLPGEAIKETRIVLDNPYNLNNPLTYKKVLLVGDNTGLLNPALVQVKDFPNPGPQDAHVIIPLELQTQEIPPDKYTGTIALKVEGAKEVLKLPVTMTMRYGPGLGIIFLVLGIGLGWFVHWMNTKGLALAKLEGDLSNLKDQVLRADLDDQTVLIPMIDKVRLMIDDGEQSQAADEMKKIETRLDLLEKMHKIETYAGSLAGDPQFEAQMNEIRKKIDLGEEDTAKQLIQQLENFKGQTPPKMQRFVASLQIQAGPVATPPPSRAKVIQWFRENWPVYSKKMLVWAFYGILLVVFVYVGLTTIYLKNPTFGVAPLTDYAALVLWGLGSDVASRNLQNVLATAKRS